ncbi:hypothetical protein PF007_g7210 [Phytophthora fragariae]|uniref:CCHC-type domain-containing protein n=1 Tax=Phytophthora fragariae TaxID=53985 RepID=A0A6A3SSG9_9STRA|nr:hypothetical protein PF007_g7210 [Phytophthora fragariae]
MEQMNAAFRVNISNRQAMKLLSSKKESTRTWNDHFLYLNAVMNASGASPTLVLENVVKYADPELKLAMMAKYDPARPDPLQQASELVNWAQSLADEEKPNKAMGRETAKETVSAMTDDRACFKCGKTGHIRRDCPLRQKKSGGDDANKVKWALAVSDRSLRPQDWILDSGASRHMVNDKNLLQDTSRCHTWRRVCSLMAPVLRLHCRELLYCILLWMACWPRFRCAMCSTPPS